MCTVTYLPSENEGFILTSNRDEKLARPSAFLPEFVEINQQSVLAPIDAKAKGTWIATTQYQTVCLLNGAFEPHLPKEKYRQSRGWVVLDAFKYSDFSLFLEDYDFSDIEPFTLVMVQHQPRILMELVWDGALKTITQKDPNQSYIWSSVTLYPPEVVRQRKQWFEEFLEKKMQRFGESNIIDFHRFGGNGDKKNDILMNRNNEFLTVSITSILADSAEKRMQYFDLVNKQDKQMQIGGW
jgi:uncharacterized protein with NRDE domain